MTNNVNADIMAGTGYKQTSLPLPPPRIKLTCQLSLFINVILASHHYFSSIFSPSSPSCSCYLKASTNTAFSTVQRNSAFTFNSTHVFVSRCLSIPLSLSLFTFHFHFTSLSLHFIHNDSGDGSALYSGLYERKSLLKETNISENKKN